MSANELRVIGLAPKKELMASDLQVIFSVTPKVQYKISNVDGTLNATPIPQERLG